MDSRGEPTVKATVVTSRGSFSASVPSGASTGKHEAKELRDRRKAFHGRGVLKAVKNIELVGKKIKGLDCNQEKIDRLMIWLDGTRKKSRLGANSILAVSIAVCKARGGYEYIAKLAKRQLKIPVPFCNIINGGKHADNKLAIQEFMIAPYKAKSFSEGIRMVSEIYHVLKKNIHKKYGKGATNLGDEGGFATKELSSARDALNIINQAIRECGYKRKVGIALDAAASEFYKKGKYHVDGKKLSREKLLDYYIDLVNDYKIISIEDPFQEDDWNEFSVMTKELGRKIQIVGDDLTVTNTERLRKAINKKAINAMLLKPNQIGTVTEALDAAKMCFSNNIRVMASHRSGDTEDSFLADFAVGIGCGQIKSGAPARSERTAKYNRILEIERELERKARYARW